MDLHLQPFFFLNAKGRRYVFYSKNPILLDRVTTSFLLFIHTFILFSLHNKVTLIWQLIVRYSSFLLYILLIGVDFAPILPLQGLSAKSEGRTEGRNFINQFLTGRSIVSLSPSSAALALLPRLRSVEHTRLFRRHILDKYLPASENVYGSI